MRFLVALSSGPKPQSLNITSFYYFQQILKILSFEETHMHAFEKEFIDFSVEVSKNSGMDPLTSRIYMMLFLEPGEISMEDIAERTGYSLASIHNKLKFLEKLAHIQKLRKPGTKKVFYHMEKDMIKVFGEMMENTYHQHIQPAKEFLPSLIEKYKNTRLTELEKKKMEIILNYYKQLMTMEKLFSKLHDEFAKLRETK